MTPRCKPRIVSALLLLGTLAGVVGIWWAWNWEPRTTHRQDWETTAQRIEKRLGIGELVLIYKKDRVGEVAPLQGLPILCQDSRKKGKQKIEKLSMNGLWVVGEDRVPNHIAKLLHTFKKLGTIRFGSVFVFHGWNNKEKGK